jgi:hypothetical protein
MLRNREGRASRRALPVVTLEWPALKMLESDAHETWAMRLAWTEALPQQQTRDGDQARTGPGEAEQ